MKPASGKRMGRVLEGRGWVLDRIAGSHHIHVHPGSGMRVDELADATASARFVL